ncbi:MAG TPA: hypothetical protein VFA39_13250 [Steroidobacteraceae bacterium]|nr:hypothetical protein [Steroidobacteraceae bacterium]
MRTAIPAVAGTRRVGLLCVALAAVLAAPGALATPTLTAPVPGGKCTLLLGGGGTVTTSDDVNSRWFVVNSAISRALMTDLSADGYRIVDFIVDIRDVNKRAAALMQRLHSAGCEQVIEVGDELRGSAANPEVVSRFAFVISVLQPKIDPAAPRTLHVGGTYQKDYEYPMTAEVLQQLSVSRLAKTMAADLEHAGALPK